MCIWSIRVILSLILSLCVCVPVCYCYKSRCEVLSQWGLICIQLMITEAKYFFMCLLAFCISCLEKYLLKSFTHFHFVSFFLLKLWVFIYILNTGFLSGVLLADVFFFIYLFWQWPLPCFNDNVPVITCYITNHTKTYLLYCLSWIL